MRKAIIFLALFFLFSVRIANAQTAITGCTNITSPGYYYLAGNINLTTGYPGVACIDITADDVELNLNGYTIENHVGWTYGIRIWNANNVKVYNGRIKYFDAIEGKAGILALGTNLEFSDLVLWGNWAGIYIFSSNVTIRECDFLHNDYGILMNGWNENYLIENNWFFNLHKDIDVTMGYNTWLENSTIIQNTFGNYTIDKAKCCVKKTVWVGGVPIETETCVMPCAGTYAGSEIAFDCAPKESIKGCERIDFIGNFFYAEQMDVHLSRSEYNRFIRNTFANSPLYNETGLYLEGDTRHNWGCENEGLIYDSGINNTFLDTCPVDIGYNVSRPCVPGWQCLDNKTLAYILNTECEIGQIINCTVACVNGRCIEQPISPAPPEVPTPPETPPELSEPLPFFNKTQLEETGWGWIIPFLSPMAFAFYIIFGISTYAASRVKQQAGIVFALTFIGGILIASLGGVIPWWAGITLILIAGGIVAYLVSKIAGE